jgi:hypothetical protein
MNSELFYYYYYYWLYSLFVRPWPLFQFLNPIHNWQDSLEGGSARHKGGTYTQDNTNTEWTHKEIRTSSGIWTHDSAFGGLKQFMPYAAAATVISNEILHDGNNASPLCKTFFFFFCFAKTAWKWNVLVLKLHSIDIHGRSRNSMHSYPLYKTANQLLVSGWVIWKWILSEGGNFTLHHIHTSSVVSPVSCRMGNKALSPGSNWPGCDRPLLSSTIFFFQFLGLRRLWVHLVYRPLFGLLYQPRIMSLKQSVEWEAGETEVLLKETCSSAALSIKNPT